MSEINKEDDMNYTDKVRLMNAKTTIYITKYLFSRGIIKEELAISGFGTVHTGYELGEIHKPYWHDNEKDAIEHSKVLLDRKIKSTQRLLDKLNNFEIIIRS